MDVNEMVASATKPSVVIGHITAIDWGSKSACVTLNSGGMGVYSLTDLVSYFNAGWYRQPSNPFTQASGAVVVVYRATSGDWPDYTVPVNVGDA